MVAFECQLKELARELGRSLLECVLQLVEPAELEAAPARIRLNCLDEFRRKPKSLLKLDTLFGTVRVNRFLYESLLAGERCFFPLDTWLGVLPGHVSPALAEKIARLAAGHTQRDVLQTIKQEHGVSLSVERLRKIVAAVAGQVSGYVCQAQVARVIELLNAAFSSTGRHTPTLVVGRDGCDIPIRGQGYKVASTATVSVVDRRGERIGTVYLGRMPEENQVTLTAELTALLGCVLKTWTGPMPRLEYVTDSGYQESHYWTVLKKMRHPITQQPLVWIRVADFYHVCQYVNKIGVALFGEGDEAARWYRKMRRKLRDKRRGARRVLHSAAALLNTRGKLSGTRQTAYETGCRYLSKRLRFMDYHNFRKRGLAIGSGVTEAGCKIVFTQRFKLSGMTWKCESGQHVLRLRTLTLSRLWTTVFHASLAVPSHETTKLKQRANGPLTHIVCQNAA
jgi:hypothetical protein